MVLLCMCDCNCKLSSSLPRATNPVNNQNENIYYFKYACNGCPTTCCRFKSSGFQITSRYYQNIHVSVVYYMLSIILTSEVESNELYCGPQEIFDHEPYASTKKDWLYTKTLANLSVSSPKSATLANDEWMYFRPLKDNLSCKIIMKDTW